MIPEIGQHVKCVLRTGALAEGIVDGWYQNEVQLKSLDGDSILIITHPEDIMLIKILLDPPILETSPSKISPLPPAQIELEQDLEKEFKKAYAEHGDNDLRVKKMAELKILLATQTKKVIADKMKNHHIGEIRSTEYGYPGPNKK